MLDSINFLDGKRKYLFVILPMLFIVAICVFVGRANRDDFDMSRREILLRRIGHELLLQSGDSTSRVLPVEKITENVYQISFEHAFTFQTDSLVNTTRRLLAKDPLAGDYVVNVLNRGKSGIAYGFAISPNKKDDIIACVGRRQPKASYVINIEFKPAGIITAKNGCLLGSLPLLAFLGFIFWSPRKPRKSLPDDQNTDVFTIGETLFDPKNRKLVINEKTIDLTGTETRLLRIFAMAPNETIERTRLQKEIWEDEGVIVGRSLDMFISKLRKKLECDPLIKIAVVRGKGYKLVIVDSGQV
ncbi:winged helix-turn-helix domain-containing protein [Mucilaginibacter sp. RS28]|uniref:Winged helix-turn-helix domain-containing protein n=1 Tax=Mucilaginibacter straminoryzae TaxID=2932774 RepID=A0A9X1XAJ3_9SPHI|nr:winged helix family transcriptional regulator [Mucilaginibacter straminoryzae]MCJ8211204.1 winged helix-turn-helix domain-containing protein [Mucilaginibacter straminoryzae]